MKRKLVLSIGAIVLVVAGLVTGGLLGKFILADPGPGVPLVINYQGVLADPGPGVPLVISYQGVLLDPGTGDPVADGEYEFTFSIYDSDTGGTHLWQEAQMVMVENGLFNVLLGSVNSLTRVFDGIPRYLGIKVGADAEMKPRQLLASVPFAFQAENAETLGGMNSSAFALAGHNHDAAYVNVNGDTMTGTLEVTGEISTGHGGLRWKLFSGTTGTPYVSFPHGLDDSKIYSISCVLYDGSGSSGMAQEYRYGDSTQRRFRVTFYGGTLFIGNIGSDFADANDWYRCIVWYVD